MINDQNYVVSEWILLDLSLILNNISRVLNKDFLSAAHREFTNIDLEEFVKLYEQESKRFFSLYIQRYTEAYIISSILKHMKNDNIAADFNYFELRSRISGLIKIITVKEVTPKSPISFVNVSFKFTSDEIGDFG